jgi:hypothetical protein
MDWEDAKEYARELRVDGKRWRLPNIDELRTLKTNDRKKAKNGYEYYIKEPFLDKIPEEYYRVWSSTEYKEGTSGAWVVDFKFGYGYYYNKRGEFCVLCVVDAKILRVAIS